MRGAKRPRHHPVAFRRRLGCQTGVSSVSIYTVYKKSFKRFLPHVYKTFHFSLLSQGGIFRIQPVFVNVYPKQRLSVDKGEETSVLDRFLAVGRTKRELATI